ncbi:MAG TPA: hypothetical protein VN879_16015 [Candidatus Acidoferrales bacterium]|nr:hypothetical protein [Candidatus Acidoferrales bacterium]
MSIFFMFLVIMLSACLAVIIAEFLTRWWDDRQEAKALLLRDIRVKDELITRLNLQVAQLTARAHMLEYALATKTKRGLYLAEAPALLRKQI